MEGRKVGGPSPAAFTLIVSPEYLYAREEAGVCHLKWKPVVNLDQGLQETIDWFKKN